MKNLFLTDYVTNKSKSIKELVNIISNIKLTKNPDELLDLMSSSYSKKQH